MDAGRCRVELPSVDHTIAVAWHIFSSLWMRLLRLAEKLTEVLDTIKYTRSGQSQM